MSRGAILRRIKNNALEARRDSNCEEESDYSTGRTDRIMKAGTWSPIPLDWERLGSC
jgi:hypothetical protein